MINVNFLGVRSASVAQSTGMVTIDPENVAAPPGEGLQDTAGAFPDILMQMLLGQQIPLNVPVKPEQPSLWVDIEDKCCVPVPETQLFTDDQPMPLQEQSLAGEMKKQSVIQKGSILSAISGEVNVSTVNVKSFISSELPLDEVEGDSIVSSGHQPEQNTPVSLLPLEQKADLPIVVQNVPHGTPTPREEKNSSVIAGEIRDGQSLNMNIPISMKKTEQETAVKDNLPLDRTESKPAPQTADLMMDEIANSDIEVPQKNSVKNGDKILNESDLVPISSNDLQHKGILSAIVTQNAKKGKNSNNDSVVTQPSSSTERRSFEVPIEIETMVTGVNTENQSTGNGSLTSKENPSRQPVFEKELTPAEVRQAQQIFSSAVETKSPAPVSGVHQKEIASMLRQQDTVNNIVELLAKNVTLSIHENNSQMKVLLKPEALGDVMLKVSIDQGKVSTQMEVQQPQVKAVIESNLQMLRDSLAGKGLVVERIDISTAQYSLNEKSSQHNQHRSDAKNIFGKEIVDEDIEQTKLFGYNTVDYVA